MFDTILYLSQHRYSLAATGLKFKEREFASRQSAETVLYSELGKRGLGITEIYDDKHYKTYCCGNGIKFYINRI